MIKFKGRHKYKQDITLNPMKSGFKVFILADAVTSCISEFITFQERDKINLSP